MSKQSDRITVDIRLTNKPSQAEIEGLLRDLCVDLGYCTITEPQWRTLTTNPPLSSYQFAAAVLAAEGTDPSSADRREIREFRDFIARRFELFEDARALDEAIRRNAHKPLIPWDQAKKTSASTRPSPPARAVHSGPDRAP